MAAGYFGNIHKWKKNIYTAAGIIFGLTSLPHLLPSLLQQGCEARNVPVPDGLQRHVEKIAAAMHVAKPHRIKVFINNGFSSISGGNTLLPYGAVLGLPRTILFKTLSDVKESGLVWEGQPIDWESHDNHMLAELLMPTAEQINFSIAHELSHIQHLDFISRSLLAPVTLLATYHLACFFHPIRNLSLGITIALGIGVLFYTFVPSTLSHWQEYRADKRAALCGRGYTEGGIATMKKKMLLERLLGQKSKLLSISSSNQIHPPYQDRLLKLEAILDRQR